MKYLLKNVRVFENKNERGLYHWLRAECFIEGRAWANPGQLPRLYSTNEEVAQMYLKYCTPDATRTDGDYKEYVFDQAKYDADTEKVDILHIDHVVKRVVKLPRPYVRCYKRDTMVDGVQHAKGEMMLNNQGEPMVVTAFDLRIAQYPDEETGEWFDSEEPDVIVARTLQRGYKPYVPPAGSTAVPEDSDPVAPALTEEQKAQQAEALKAQLQALGINA